MEIIQSPQLFFFDLLSETEQKYTLHMKQEVKAYLVGLLTHLVIDQSRINLNDSLSLIYLEACEQNNKDALRVIGDSCLFTLGFFPSYSKSTYRNLYYDLGVSSYGSLSQQGSVYLNLSIDFNRIVDLLLGTQLILDQSPERCTNLWWTTKSKLVEKQLRQQRVIPLYR